MRPRTPIRLCSFGAEAPAIGAPFGVEAEAKADVALAYLDTPDRALHDAGLVLEVFDRGGEREVRLREIDTDAVVTREGTVPGALPRSAGDLPGEALQAAVGAVDGGRPLLLVAAARGAARGLRVRDRSGKIVARAGAFPGLEFPGACASLLEIDLLRGFDHLETPLRAALSGPAVPVGRDTWYHPLLADAAGEPPVLRPLGEPWWPESAFAPADLVVRRFLGSRLEELRRVLRGVALDVDPEFVHEARVLCRTLRSTLRELGRPEDADCARARTRLGDLARAAGPLRDLDVLAATIRAEAHRLPPEVASGVGGLLAAVAAERETARIKLVAHLESPAHAAAMGELEGFAASAPPTRSDAVGPRATRRARRRLRKIQRGFAAPAPSSEALHALRIQCKKLRYLVDSAHRVMDIGEPLRLAPSMKELQRVLGDLQDLAVQKALIAGLMPRLGGEAAAAAGGIAVVLEMRRASAHAELETLRGRLGPPEAPP